MLLGAVRGWLGGAQATESPRRELKHKLSARLTEDDAAAASAPAPAWEEADEEEEDGDRLLTWEFIAYWLVAAYAALAVLYAGCSVSRRIDDRAPGVLSLHARLGLQRYMKSSVDLSDPEWRQLRPLALPLATLMLLFTLLSLLVQRFASQQRTAFYIASGLALTGYLHEACVAPLLAAAALSYLTADAVAGTRYGAHALWALHLSHLALCQLLSGLQPVRLLGASLADAGGQLPWAPPFRLACMRMLSFGLDLHRQRTGRGGAAGADIPASGSAGDLKARLLQPLPQACYSPAAFAAFLLYPPLYLAGPLLSFKSFASQLRCPKATPPRQLCAYAAGVLLLGAALEGGCHLLFTRALAASGAWAELGALRGFRLEGWALAALGLLPLAFLLLKHAALWRFGRLWALLDGVGAPEDVRLRLRSLCSSQELWRTWAASQHLWLLRYAYVPLGGGQQRPLLARAACFALSALRLGLSPATAAFAACGTAALSLELLVKWAVREQPGLARARPALLRHLAALGAAANMCLLAGMLLGCFLLGAQTPAYLAALAAHPAHAAGCFLSLFCLAQLLLELSGRAGSTNSSSLGA